MFRDASGPLYEFLREIGRDVSDCGDQTPLGHFLGILRDSSTSLGSARNDKKASTDGHKWIIAHLNELADRDFELLEKSNIKLHIVHSPRSHDYFRHSRFSFERLRGLGFNVCLGTDSLASNESLSLCRYARVSKRISERFSGGNFPNGDSKSGARIAAGKRARPDSPRISSRSHSCSLQSRRRPIRRGRGVRRGN